MQKSIKVTDETYKLLKEIKDKTGIPFVWIIKKAIKKLTAEKRIK